VDKPNGFHREDPQPGVVLMPAAPAIEHALALQRTPQIVIDEARKAAAALTQIIESNPDKLVLNKKTYLFFEQWQMLARFYGVTTGAADQVPTKFVEYGEARGFEACAEAVLVSTGQVISRAEAMCLDDEWKWEGKPLFQLKSMAQTRACAKALRNVLAWVVVLAGYCPTPAEEIEGDRPSTSTPAPAASPTIPPPPAGAKPIATPRRAGLISDAQIGRLYAIARDRQLSKADVNKWLATCGFASVKEIPKARYDAICNALMGVQ
jgi:hypothetical protein